MQNGNKKSQPPHCYYKHILITQHPICCRWGNSQQHKAWCQVLKTQVRERNSCCSLMYNCYSVPIIQQPSPPLHVHYNFYWDSLMSALAAETWKITDWQGGGEPNCVFVNRVKFSVFPLSCRKAITGRWGVRFIGQLLILVTGLMVSWTAPQVTNLFLF